MRHGTDPEPPWRAIRLFARLIAQGLLGAEEACAALAAAPAPGADRSGWQARRAWHLADATAAWQRARGRARRDIMAAAAPLLAVRASRAALLDAAAAADPRAAMRPAEREALLLGLVAKVLAQGAGAARCR